MKHFLPALLLLLVSAPATADHQSPRDVVEETTAQVLSRLAAERDELTNNPDRMQLLVQEIIIPHFDFDTMARLVLSRYWRYLDDSQKQCFSNGFRNSLTGRYATILLSYDNQAIEYGPGEAYGERGYMTISQEITLKGGDVVVEYPMRPLEDGWKVIDLVIDDISLVHSHRHAYEEEIRNSNLELFLENISADCIY